MSDQDFRVYLSGPMTGYPEFNFPAFHKAAKYLREELGFWVSNPAEKEEEGWTWEQCLRYDLIEVCKVDAIVTLPDWEKSKGANLEVATARGLNMPVLRLDAVEDWWNFFIDDLYKFTGKHNDDTVRSWRHNEVIERELLGV